MCECYTVVYTYADPDCPAHGVNAVRTQNELESLRSEVDELKRELSELQLKFEKIKRLLKV